ncbi:hypothetical protein [Lactobacillus helveticus]|uniref:hypothetical protein n=1 Tax=Lactobacillus helveticus TaxID=1587 RepID=UPI0013FE3D01|nr:hypothetical protein [Lactobacillus helveticus]NRO82316.1 hypothetical protein [Lactobacillus helveticus]
MRTTNLGIYSGVVDKSEAWLEREVKAAGYNGINDVFLGECIDGQLRLTGYSK